MFKPVLISFTFFYFLFCEVRAENDANELQQKYLSYVMECVIENPVTPEDLEELKNQKMPDKENVKCLFACAYKKAGMMTVKGELNIEGVLDISKQYMASDPEKLKMTEDFVKTCSSVNNVSVSDGDKGCERAALIFSCSVERTPKVDISNRSRLSFMKTGQTTVKRLQQKQALTEEEIKTEFTKIVMKCTKDHPVEMSELLSLQQLVVPKQKETKCLLACAYKAEGIMNSKGMYDIKHAYEIAELSKNGDEKRLENGKKMADICVKVNDIAVSDGEKGCDRAALIFKCTIETAPKFGFKIM